MYLTTNDDNLIKSLELLDRIEDNIDKLLTLLLKYESNVSIS